MLDAVFQSIRSTANVGDLACSPATYFDFGTSQVFDFGSPLPKAKRAIFGGGQVFDNCANAVIYDAAQAKHKINWGIGLSRKAMSGFQFDIVHANCSLFSTRNWEFSPLDYVPCVSCMAPELDRTIEPLHDVVMFTHATKSAEVQVPDGVPALSNHECTFAQAIAHIASGETVVTNSYHGTYWAMLLGRRVLCIPFQEKFNHFRHSPAMSTPRDWAQDLKTAQAFDGYLDHARGCNTSFYDRVMNLS